MLLHDLRAQLDRQSVYQVIVRAAKELLGCATCAIALQDPDRPVLVRAAQAGVPGPEELPLRYDTLTGRAFHENRTILDNSYAASSKALPAMVQSGYRAGMATPLCDAMRPIGVLVCGHTREGASVDRRASARIRPAGLPALARRAAVGSAGARPARRTH